MHASATALPSAAGQHFVEAGELQALVDGANARFGKIDILVCNAASNPYYGPMAGIGDEQFRKILDNKHHFQSLADRHGGTADGRAQGGAVIIVSSIGGLRGSPVIGAYNVSKAADFQLARNYAVELGPTTCGSTNCIAPGLIKTDFARASGRMPSCSSGVRQPHRCAVSANPTRLQGRRCISPAGGLVSVTGQAIVVDGGVTIGS